MRGDPSLRSVPTKQRPVRSNRSSPSPASSGASAANSSQFTPFLLACSWRERTEEVQARVVHAQDGPAVLALLEPNAFGKPRVLAGAERAVRQERQRLLLAPAPNQDELPGAIDDAEVGVPGVVRSGVPLERRHGPRFR